MRQTRIPFSLAAAAAVLSLLVPPADAATRFTIRGAGFGHGVGMSQYGAYGYAQHGATYEQILAHYYPGTALGPAPVSTIRVLLAEKKKTLKLSSQSDFTIRDAAGTRLTVPAGTLAVTPKLALRGKTLQPPLAVS